MSKYILLYGATGFSGRLIAQAAAERKHWGPGSEFQLVLSGRNGAALARLARRLDMPMRAFALNDEERIDAVVGSGVYALVNAAGPFSFTAEPLVRAALRNRVHYVDINGEADVYKRLDDFSYLALQRGVALVSGAGHSAATSDLMLRAVLERLQPPRRGGEPRLGTVRIAFSHLRHVSRGSAQTAWRSIRDQAMIARPGPADDGFRPMYLGYEPTGRIERMFDFGDAALARERDQLPLGARPPTRRIAMAANLLDLLAARIAVNQARIPTGRIEAYIEMPEGARVFVQVGAMGTLLNMFPGWRRSMRAAVQMLPEGPDEYERKLDRHTVLLEIDDGEGRTLVDWRVETPDPYEFTAECVLAAVEGLNASTTGWRRPAQLIQPLPTDPRSGTWPLPGCLSEARIWEIPP